MGVPSRILQFWLVFKTTASSSKENIGINNNNDRNNNSNDNMPNSNE